MTFLIIRFSVVYLLYNTVCTVKYTDALWAVLMKLLLKREAQTRWGKCPCVCVEACACTYLATCALVIEGAESDGREEDGDVEEDGCGHVLQQGFITANYTWGETNTNMWVIFNS